MTGAARDPGTSANFRYTTSTDMTDTAESDEFGHGTPCAGSRGAFRHYALG
jgi:hypothetical protein